MVGMLGGGGGKISFRVQLKSSWTILKCFLYYIRSSIMQSSMGEGGMLNLICIIWGGTVGQKLDKSINKLGLSGVKLSTA